MVTTVIKQIKQKLSYATDLCWFIWFSVGGTDEGEWMVCGGAGGMTKEVEAGNCCFQTLFYCRCLITNSIYCYALLVWLRWVSAYRTKLNRALSSSHRTEKLLASFRVWKFFGIFIFWFDGAAQHTSSAYTTRTHCSSRVNLCLFYIIKCVKSRVLIVIITIIALCRCCC